MAKIEPLGKFILSWEGGFVNDPADRGGATNKGVTLRTWQAQGWDKNHDGKIDVTDLKLISDADAIAIMKRDYWDRWRADQISSQAIANILVDWVWASGVWGIKIPQDMLGCRADGIVGQKTLAALDRQDPVQFFARLKERREQYLYDICKSRPANKKFLKGWLRRLNSINYYSMVCNNGKTVTW
jgi:lysozyme family protein